MSQDKIAFDINQPFVTQEQKFKYWEESKAEIKRLKAALVEIDKCEPELYMAKNLHNKSYATSHSEAEARLFLLQSGLKVDGIESEVIPLCHCSTSPQPRDWNSIHDDDITDIATENYKNGNWDIDFARAIEAKLKQLNTEG